MTSVKIKASELLQVVLKNRETHRKIFLEAQEGYRAAAIAELDVMLAEAREGKRIRRAVSLIEPVDQTQEYDRVVRMLEMTVEDSVELAAHEFDAYVMDRWTWKQQFNASNRRYSKTLSDMSD